MVAWLNCTLPNDLLAKCCLWIPSEVIKQKDPHSAATYAGVASKVRGDIGMWAVRCAIAINNFGLVVAYLIIIGDVLTGKTGVVAEFSHRKHLWWW